MIGIYRIENLINHKNYIGQSMQIDTRWSAHKRLAFEPNAVGYEYPLYKAIRKYGLENFNFTILEECLEEQLDERETYWIKQFEAFGPKGYNQTSGGAGYRKAPPTEVITLFQQGYSIDDLCVYFDATKSTIIQILHAAGLGYITQEEKNTLQPTCKIVEQYNLSGNLLNTYFSEGAAAKAIQTSRASISSACHNHNTAYGYIWKFQDDPITGKEIANNLKQAEENRKKAVSIAVLKRCCKKVNQYDTTGKYIQTFPSVVDAGRSLNKGHGCIARVCRGEGKVSYGFIWKYVSEDFPEGQNLDIGGG